MPDPAGSSGLVLDANVCINLLATEAVADLLGGLAVPCHIPGQVLAEVTRDPVTRAALTDAGHPLRRHAPALSIATLVGDEIDLFIDLVGAAAPDGLGDGESAAIAIAVHRGLDIAIDDRKARRIIHDRFPRLQLFWTVNLLRAPSVIAALGVVRAADLFDRARRHGRMHVPRL